MLNSSKILIILLIGGIWVQAIYAKKDKAPAAIQDTAAVVVKKEKVAKKTAVKDSVIVLVEEKPEKKEKKTEPKEETEIKIEGILEVGFDNQYRYNPYNEKKPYKERVTYKRLGKAEVDISFRPVKKVKADVGFEYNSKDSMPTIDKLYGQYNPFSFSSIRFGYMKKSFGLEERTGLDERFFHKRSIINDFLDSLNKDKVPGSAIGFLGHDLTLQYRHEIGKKFELRGGFSWTTDSLRYLQNYSAEYNDKKNNVILATIIKHYLRYDLDADTMWITTYVSSLSYKRTDKLFASETELTFGTNPLIKATEIYEKNGKHTNRDATILGARLKENFFINTGLSTLQQVIPVAEAAVFSRDFKMDSTEFDAQFRAGLTLGFAKKSAFQWRNNYGVIAKINEDTKYPWQGDLWRRRFDTEVVVVF